MPVKGLQHLTKAEFVVLEVLIIGCLARPVWLWLAAFYRIDLDLHWGLKFSTLNRLL